MILNDTTHRHVLKSLKQNNDYKTMLLSTLSHELRTPLNCSLVMLRTAIEYLTIEENLKRKYLVPALNSFFILQSIVDDVLDYWSIFCKNFTLNDSKFNLRYFLIETLTIFQLQAEEKNLGLSLTIEEEVPEEVVADIKRIKQLLMNFLVNSFKFTFKGEIGITVRRENSDILKFSVHDTGIGIENDYLEKIKMSIKQPKHIKIGKYSAGIGFGLRFGHMVSQYLSGDKMKFLEVNSNTNTGTEISFYVEISKNDATNTIMLLPSNILTDNQKNSKNDDSIEFNGTINILKLNAQDDKESNNFNSKYLDENGVFSIDMNIKQNKSIIYKNDHMTNQQHDIKRPVEIIRPMHTSCKCKDILLIDDDMFNLISLKSLLTKMSPGKIDLAFNGKLGIEKVEMKLRNKCCNTCSGFKIIIMDINMPEMDGFEATTILKQRMKEGKMPNIPIIGCTADTDPSIRKKCLDEIFMDDFITKPINPNQLRKIIEYFC